MSTYEYFYINIDTSESGVGIKVKYIRSIRYENLSPKSELIREFGEKVVGKCIAVHCL
jgi:hypothetical protein